MKGGPMKKRTIKGWVRKLRQDGIRKRFLRWVISIVLSHHHLAKNGPGEGRRGLPMELTDLGLQNDNWIIKKIANENVSQLTKWGIQTHSSFEWLTYTAEELGSLAKAIGDYEYRDGTKEKVVSEAVQVATLALKIAEMFEKVEVTNDVL